MKKNILAIAILAAVLADIILTAVMLISVVPAAKQNAALVTKICQVIDLELENPDAADYKEVPLKARVPKTIGENITINLRRAEGDTKDSFCVLNEFTIVFNNESEAFKDTEPTIDNQKTVLNNYVVSKISQYTKQDLIEHKADIEKEVLSYCRTYFGSQDLVVEVVLSFMVS